MQYPESLDEIKRIGVLLSLGGLGSVGGFATDAVSVAYHADTIIFVTGTSSTPSVAVRTRPQSGRRFADGHRRVVEQGRLIDQYVAQHPHHEDSVEEDTFRYEPQRNIDTRNVHRLRKRDRT